MNPPALDYESGAVSAVKSHHTFLPPCQQFDLESIWYLPCCTKSIFVIFSWEGMWKMSVLASYLFFRNTISLSKLLTRQPFYSDL